MLSIKEPLGKFEVTMMIVASILLAWIIVAPLTLPHASVTDLSGTIGPIDNEDQIEKMNFFAQAIYYLGDINCHQMAERSYFLNGNEMPVCARDLGIFIGLPIGILICFIASFRPRLYQVVLAAVPMGIDGGLQAVTDYESFNSLRLATGFFGGLAVAFFLVMIASEMYCDREKPEK